MTVAERAPRAKPMAPEARRAAIARAALPLVMAHGREVTTRQLAEAAGVAEGTLFRVFDDKDAIIDAAVAQFLDPEPFRDALRDIDPGLPLESKLGLVIDRFHERMRGIFGIFSVIGTRPEPPQLPGDLDVVTGIFERLLAPDADRLRVPPAKVFLYLRAVAFSTSLPQFAVGAGLAADELAAFIVTGVARGAPPGPAPAGTAPAASRSADPAGPPGPGPDPHPTERIDESESS